MPEEDLHLSDQTHSYAHDRPVKPGDDSEGNICAQASLSAKTHPYGARRSS